MIPFVRWSKEYIISSIFSFSAVVFMPATNEINDPSEEAKWFVFNRRTTESVKWYFISSAVEFMFTILMKPPCLSVLISFPFPSLPFSHFSCSFLSPIPSLPFHLFLCSFLSLPPFFHFLPYPFRFLPFPPFLFSFFHITPFFHFLPVPFPSPPFSHFLTFPFLILNCPSLLRSTESCFRGRLQFLSAERHIYLPNKINTPSSPD